MSFVIKVRYIATNCHGRYKRHRCRHTLRCRPNC